MIRVTPIPALSDNYIWALERPSSGATVIVDPGIAGPALEFLQTNNLKPEAIILTHHHADHCGGATEVARVHDCPIFGPAAERIQGVDRPVENGDRLRLALLDLEFEVIGIPGHTAGHVAYLCDDILLCGDTLFAGGCGRLFEGTPEQMHRSLQRLAALPPNTRVCCAHEYTIDNLRFAQAVEPGNRLLGERLLRARNSREHGRPTLPSTIGEELATNPFLRCSEPEVIASAEAHSGRTPAPGTEVFTVLRSWKDRFAG